MDMFPIFGGFFAFIASIYVWVRDNNKIRASLVIIAIMWFVFTFYTLTRFDQEGLTYLASNYRFCSRQNSPNCLLSGEYNRYRQRDITSGPSSSVCQYCRRPVQVVTRDVIRYVKIEEGNLVNEDIEKIRSLLGSQFEEEDSVIGDMIGVSDLSPSKSTDINTSFGIASQYIVPIRNDKVFPKLVNFDRSCLKRSELRTLVSGGSVVTLTWVGKVEERCFDSLWWPSLVRSGGAVILDRNRGGDISSYIRYSDDDFGRFLVISSKKLDSREGSVGLWISFISPRVPLTSVYDDYGARGIFRVIDPIANE